MFVFYFLKWLLLCYIYRRRDEHRFHPLRRDVCHVCFNSTSVNVFLEQTQAGTLFMFPTSLFSSWIFYCLFFFFFYTCFILVSFRLPPQKKSQDAVTFYIYSKTYFVRTMVRKQVNDFLSLSVSPCFVLFQNPSEAAHLRQLGCHLPSLHGDGYHGQSGHRACSLLHPHYD